LIQSKFLEVIYAIISMIISSSATLILLFATDALAGGINHLSNLH
jgi:hypothetical protein